VRYWLFYIMPDIPTSWSAMLRRRIAAQDYHRYTLRMKSNTEALSKIRDRDGVLAAYGRHRFVGYRALRSDFRRSS
jgi:hypothetical protein